MQTWESTIRYGLFTRIALSLGVLFTLAMLAVGYMVVNDAEQRFQQERLQLVTAGAKTLAEGSLDALVTGDYELLERWVTSVLLTDDYAYAFLAKPTGQVLTHSELEQVAHYTDPVDFAGKTSTSRRRTFNGEAVLEVVYPARIGKQHLANAHVAYFVDRKAIAGFDNMSKLYALIAATLLLILAATLIIVRRHTHPISQLTDYIAHLTLDAERTALAPALLRRTDEVGMLARAFEAMSNRLHKAFEALRHEEERLRVKVDERTAELLRSNRELEAFSYSVSHDLRAPLRSIDGFSLMLAEDYGDKLDEEGQHTIARIRRAAQRMAGLIDDLLELSQISRVKPVTTEVNLSPLAHSVTQELAAATPHREAEWIIAPEAKTQGDKNLLRILLVNLLENAWKYSAKAEQAKIEFGVCIKGNKTTYFVRDNGAGFDMQYRERLFKPFSRLHGEHEFKGTGIGLATAQRIIEHHRGRIWAEGTPGEGATFYFQLNNSVE